LKKNCLVLVLHTEIQSSTSKHTFRWTIDEFISEQTFECSCLRSANESNSCQCFTLYTRRSNRR